MTFAGAQSTLPASGLSSPQQIALDSTGNLFIADSQNNQVVELPLTPRGYGPQTTLPISGLVFPNGVAVNSAGDLFIANTFNGGIQEVLRTTTGYDGPLTTVASDAYFPTALAVDGAGDIFDSELEGAYEYPRTPQGYGQQIYLLSDNYDNSDDPNNGIAVDSAGDVFIVDQNSSGNVVEFTKTATGFGAPTYLVGANSAGVAVDAAGDLFFGILLSAASGQLMELPRTATGYGPQITLPATGLSGFQGLAVDSTGNVFISDTNNNRIVEMQTRSVNFYGVNACASGQTTPAPCSETLTLNFTVNAGVTLGTPKVLTGGAPNLAFTLAGGSTCTGAVTEGSSCIVNVTFAPLAVGVKTGSVEIIDGSGNVLTTTTIYGAGLPVAAGSPVAQVSTNLLQFGTLTFGSSGTLPLTVSNTGGGVLIVSPSINGQSYTIAGSTCGLGVVGGNSCTLEVQFSPISVGAHNDILTLQTNEPSTTAVNLQGVASGVSTATKTLQFATISFGATEVLPLTFTNTATAGTVTIGTKISGPSYKVLTTAQNTCQAGIAAGQSCTLPVEFSPATVGAHDDFLTLTPSADAPSTYVALEGAATGVTTELETPLNFGTIPNSTTAVLPLTITNLGVSGTVTVGTAINGASFQILTTAQNTCLAGIAAGQSCTLPVQFSPMSVGAHNELLTLTPSADAAASTVHLDGIASGVPLGQIVTFTGAQTGVTYGLSGAIAVDGASDVFVIFGDCCGGNATVTEFSLTATGYGPVTFPPTVGVNCPASAAADSAGDLFIADCSNNNVVELPLTTNGFGTQITLVSGLSGAVAADGPGDLFILSGNELVELPKTASGYEPQADLPVNSLNGPAGVAVDFAGDLFIADAGNNQVVELPLTAAGYGPPTPVASGVMGLSGIAVDGTDDIFLVENSIVVELPRTTTGYGPPLTVLSPTAPWYFYPVSIAALGGGDVFVSEEGYPFFPGGGPVLEIQTRSVNFEGANICAPGQTTPVPCSQSVPLTFNINVDVTLGTPNVLTNGAPNLDFTLASGNTCTGVVTAGTTCTVNVTFAPLAAGVRSGAVEITDGTGKVLTTVPIYGTGITN